jgi:DNA-binding CsgD family transcriptional regulator
MESARRVTIVAPVGSSLGVAMRAALAAKGWSATMSAGSPGQPPSGAAEEPPSAPLLIVVEDDGGWAHPPAASTEAGALVCLGSVKSLDVLISFASQGATVLNQAAPFPVLVRAVEDALLATEDRAVANQVDTLLRRQAEAAALASLTAAEEDALRGLMTGLTAAQMAAGSHRSINTVRSQIKAVLGKLGVQTQLTGVAIAHRSGRWGWQDKRWRTFINFGDD